MSFARPSIPASSTLHGIDMTSAKREVCFLIGNDGGILYADVSASPTALPDSRRRWEAIWAHRESLEEISHSHPLGSAEFSSEDETTIAAIRSALGRCVRFSVVSVDEMRVRVDNEEQIVAPEPWWADLMRYASGMRVKEK